MKLQLNKHANPGSVLS